MSLRIPWFDLQGISVTRNGFVTLPESEMRGAENIVQNAGAWVSLKQAGDMR